MIITDKDKEQIIELSKDPTIHDKIIKSIAPSIKGYREIKEAIALQLFGGTKKRLENNTPIRNEIRIGIVGDENVDKKKLIESIANVSLFPLSYTITDNLNSISGKLITCYNFNNFSEEYQQLILSNKIAPIIVTGTPKYGYFDKYKLLKEQIEFSQKIISSFDLMFIIEDKPNKEKDSNLVDHIFEIHNENINYEIEPELLRKYIAYARKNINPCLTDEANYVIKEFYITTRSSAPDDCCTPINAKQLYSIIRLAEASAKIKLKDNVEKEDVEKAIKLTMFCLKDIVETDEIDIDPFISETPQRSERDMIQNVYDEFKLLEEEFRQVPLMVVISVMRKKYGLSEDKTEKIVMNLLSKGVFYQPHLYNYVQEYIEVIQKKLTPKR